MSGINTTMIQGSNTRARWCEGFGIALKRILEQRNMTQSELAEGIGQTEASISRYVTGERVPKASTLIDMCNYLNVSVDRLVNMTMEVSDGK